MRGPREGLGKASLWSVCLPASCLSPDAVSVQSRLEAVAVAVRLLCTVLLLLLFGCPALSYPVSCVGVGFVVDSGF